MVPAGEKLRGSAPCAGLGPARGVRVALLRPRPPCFSAVLEGSDHLAMNSLRSGVIAHKVGRRRLLC